MDRSDPVADLEYRAEFWRQQFDLYEARRLAEETHANVVLAAAVAVGAFVLADYGRTSPPRSAWLVFMFGVALGGLAWAFALAINARVVSWETPGWRGGAKPPANGPPSVGVGETLDDVRDLSDEDRRELRQRVIQHWQARQYSAWKLGKVKQARLRWSLWGLLGPLAYFAVRLLMM